MGRPKSRNPDLDGVLVIDKPAGWTSHDVVAKLRGITGQRRSGHTGTLDPAATGVLVVCLGRATRLVRFLQAGRKTYQARMVLGRTTTTQDAEGDVVAEVDASGVTQDDVRGALDDLRGKGEQVPPMVSAVKVGGRRLHELAREGQEVEREARPVTIHDIELDDFVAGPLAEAEFTVTCSAGTYVRTLAHDVGARLGVGGSLTALRRTCNGSFGLDDAVSIDDVAAAAEADRLRDVLVPIERALAFLPAVDVDRDGAIAATQGKPVPPADLDGPWILRHDGRAVGVFTDGPRRANSEVVLLQPADLQPAGGTR